jgi:NitT/TauT family transport system substrate-binding protein
VCTAQPYAGSAIQGLGANAVSWSAQSHRPLHGLAISTNAWLGEHPELAIRFLRSLQQAEEYALSHIAESKAVVQQALDLDPAYMDTVWSQNQFGLSLDQSLVISMEDEARWIIANNLTAEKQVPNFTNYIYQDALKAVKPDAVNIIR